VRALITFTVSTFLMWFVIFAATAMIFVPAVSAQNVEQEDCAVGFIVNADATGCIPSDGNTDPGGCRAAGGGADEVERCLQEASNNAEECNLNQSFLGFPVWYKYLDTEVDSTGRCSPVLSGGDSAEQVNSVLPIGLAILEGLLRVSGLAAVVMIFVAGFRFITSQGNPENAAAARKTAINAVIGLVIVIIATSLVSFVGGRLL